MKSLNHFRSFKTCKKRGFALIITLSLMILLTVIAVGLLTLSSISLRASAQGDAMATARANARFALMLAIGDLQAAAGQDTRITAPAGVLGTNVNQQQITGVWRSKKLGPNSTPADFTASAKTSEFVRWLVSGNPTDQRNEAFALNPPGTGRDVLDFVSPTNVNLGVARVQARKVAIRGNGSTSASTGNFAYAVLDEAVKARVNLGINRPSSDLAGLSTALGAGQRPSLDAVQGIGNLPSAQVDLTTPAGRALAAKMISIPTAEFAYGATPSNMSLKLHDLTANSQGLLVDVANGGLKRDFNLLSDETESTGIVPMPYTGLGIYQQSFNRTVVSDPSWTRAIAWSRIFGERSRGILARRAVGGVDIPTLTASAPPGWVAGTGRRSSTTNSGSATLSLVEPPGPVLLPAVAKVQMSFALAARDVYRYTKDAPIPKDARGGNPKMHESWATRFQENLRAASTPRTFDSPYDYLLHMVYSPIITLHNPYSVPITFQQLRIEFVNVPFAFQVFKKDENGVRAQSTEPVPFSLMYSSSVAGGQSKRFGLNLTDTLQPGEVKIYSPRIDASRTWQAEVTAGKKEFWDWGNRNEDDARAGGGTNTDTSRAEGIAGWNGVRVGYDLDFLAPGNKQAYPTEKVGSAEIDRWSGIPLKLGDEVYVESTPIQDPKLPERKFSIEMTLNHATGAINRTSALVFEFGSPSDLQDVMMRKNPQAQNGKIRAPAGTDMWSTLQLFDHGSVALRDVANTRAFALFSATAKTTSSGSDPDGYEGLWASKPFTFQNHTSPAITQTITSNSTKGHPSHFSHELALSRFPETGLSVQGTTNRGLFMTGSRDTTGLRFGSLYEVPLAPLQSFSSLNGAQLAASPYLPHYSAPVGNSYAHPLMSGTSPIEAGLAGHEYADHSFLLNSALYDSFYFSGLQTRATTARFGDGKTRDNLVDGFLDSNNPNNQIQSPLTDQNLKPYFSDGTVRADVATTLKANGAFSKAAAYQVIEGPFNVNSISETAWKAVLSAMTGENALAFVTSNSNAAGTTIQRSPLSRKSDPNGARFSRFRIPNGQMDRTTPDGPWRGPIDLTENELNSLAREIVRQVQARGPFLSMAEFVNRQLGTTDEKALAGALQTAIDRSEVNRSAATASPGNFRIGPAQTTDLMLKNAKTLEGDSIQGAPGYLMQSDILSVLGNSATVRSDTFKVRSYGEAVDRAGNITARAYCEAVVQRNPEFVDSRDRADQAINALVSTANINFGRKFTIVSVRWLSPTEI